MTAIHELFGADFGQFPYGCPYGTHKISFEQVAY